MVDYLLRASVNVTGTKKDVAVMYSGGLDSYIALFYALSKGLNPIPVYVDLGHPYAFKERRAIQGLAIPAITLNLSSLFGHIEGRMTNQIIPSRNALLGVIGSMIAPRVWIAAVDGEQLGKERDKSPEFFAQMTELVTMTNSFFVDETLVETPFPEMSKAELVGWAIENNVSNLRWTVSCYYDIEGHCGNCLTCYKRWSAFMYHGIDTTDQYRNKPFWSEYAHDMRQEIPIAEHAKDYSRFTPKRMAEHWRVIAEFDKIHQIIKD